MRLLNSRLSIFVRGIVQNLLAFFRFTEADALVLLSAYGLHALELDRLQNSRTDEPPEANGNVRKLSQSERAGEPPAPIPVGVHPISFGRTQPDVETIRQTRQSSENGTKLIRQNMIRWNSL